MKECTFLISFFNDTKGMSEEEVAEMKVSYKKGFRLRVAGEYGALGLYGRFVHDLGANDCMVAALRIYFGQNFGSVQEFYGQQLALNKLPVRADNS